MEIEIATTGGYNAVGRQMTAVCADDNGVIFDMGPPLSQVPIRDDVHVSGHLWQGGHYQMLDALQPRHVSPAHQGIEKSVLSADLCQSQGCALGWDLHVTHNSTMIQLVE